MDGVAVTAVLGDHLALNVRLAMGGELPYERTEPGEPQAVKRLDRVLKRAGTAAAVDPVDQHPGGHAEPVTQCGRPAGRGDHERGMHVRDDCEVRGGEPFAHHVPACPTAPRRE